MRKPKITKLGHGVEVRAHYTSIDKQRPQWYGRGGAMGPYRRYDLRKDDELHW